MLNGFPHIKRGVVHYFMNPGFHIKVKVGGDRTGYIFFNTPHGICKTHTNAEAHVLADTGEYS